MPDLVNLLDHMRGKAVLVNGTIYPIDEQGIAKDVSEPDAAKLLCNNKWMVYDPDAAAKREERRKAVREDFKKQRGGMPLITKDGKLVDPEAMKKAAAAAAAEKAKAKAKAIAKAEAEAQQAQDEYPSMQPEESTEKSAASTEESDETPIELPSSPDEWPDPEVGMKKPYLQAMANAYGLQGQYTQQTKKQDLVDLILKAMYDEV